MGIARHVHRRRFSWNISDSFGFMITHWRASIMHRSVCMQEGWHFRMTPELGCVIIKGQDLKSCPNVLGRPAFASHIKDHRRLTAILGKHRNSACDLAAPLDAELQMQRTARRRLRWASVFWGLLDKSAMADSTAREGSCLLFWDV